MEDEIPFVLVLTFLYLYSMQLSVWTLQYFQKEWFFTTHENLKKRASKVANNQPKPFFSQSSPAHSPELIFHVINMPLDALSPYLWWYLMYVNLQKSKSGKSRKIKRVLRHFCNVLLYIHCVIKQNIAELSLDAS